MIFNFQTFRRQLLSTEFNKNIVIEYEKVHGKMKNKLKDNYFYKHYVSLFEFDLQHWLLVPKEVENNFDLQLLTMLVVSSFDTEYQFHINKNVKIDLEITVKHSHKKVTVLLSTLNSAIILNFFNVFILRLIVHSLENDDSQHIERLTRLYEFQEKMSQLKNANKPENAKLSLNEILLSIHQIKSYRGLRKS